MASGTIIRFNHLRGYGFIKQDDGGDDVFLHSDEIRESGLAAPVGTRISFTTVQSERGLRARDVAVLDQAATRADGSESHSRHRRFEMSSTTDFQGLVTDTLIEVSPSMTASQIVEIRQRLAVHAYQRGWLADR